MIKYQITPTETIIVAALLAACGLPGCFIGKDEREALLDGDNDSVPLDEDCDGTQGDRYPGAEERCGDGVLQDCSAEGREAEVAALKECSGWNKQASVGEGASVLTGGAADALLGWRVRAPGDVDGDGLADLLVSGGTEVSGAQEDSIQLFHGQDIVADEAPTPVAIWTPSVTVTDENTTVMRFSDFVPVGDFGADGGVDILVSAEAYTLFQGHINRSYLYLISADAGTGDFVSQAWLSGDPIDGVNSLASTPGDITGDGADDVLVGGSQAAYVFTGAATGLSAADTTIKFTGNGTNAFGASVAATDLDGDGVSDVASVDSDDRNGGAIYVFFSESTPVAGVVSSSDGVRLLDGAGVVSVMPAGDVSGDGTPDLIACTWGALKLLNKDGAWTTLEDTPSAVDCLSPAVSPIGDLDEDGREDLLIGGPEAFEEKGEVYLVLGADLDGLSHELGEVAWVTLSGEDAGDYAGASVAGPGDVNGDGRPDLLIGVPGDDRGGDDAGAAFLFFTSTY